MRVATSGEKWSAVILLSQMGDAAQKKQATGLLESEDLPGYWDTALLYGGPTSMHQLVFPPYPSPAFWSQLVYGYLAVFRLCLGSPNAGYTKPCLAPKVVQEWRCLGGISSSVGYWSSRVLYCPSNIDQVGGKRFSTDSYSSGGAGRVSMVKGALATFISWVKPFTFMQFFFLGTWASFVNVPL